MPFPFLAAGAALLPSIFQGITGASQARRGRKLAESNVRPTYYRPNEVKQGLSLAEQAYYNGAMPGSAMAENNISSASANAYDELTQGASSSGDIIDGLSKINYNEGQQLNDLSAQQAAFKAQQLQDLQQQLGIGAQYSDKEFAYNQDQPYRETAAEASALIGAGNANIGNAINGASSLATSALLDQFGRNNGTSSTTASNPTNSSFNPVLNQKMVYDPYLKKMRFY